MSGASSELRAEEPLAVLRPDCGASDIIEGRFTKQLTAQKFGLQVAPGVGRWRWRRVDRVVIAQIDGQGHECHNSHADLGNCSKTGHQWNIWAGWAS